MSLGVDRDLRVLPILTESLKIQFEATSNGQEFPRILEDTEYTYLAVTNPNLETNLRSNNNRVWLTKRTVRSAKDSEPGCLLTTNDAANLRFNESYIMRRLPVNEAELHIRNYESTDDQAKISIQCIGTPQKKLTNLKMFENMLGAVQFASLVSNPFAD